MGKSKSSCMSDGGEVMPGGMSSPRKKKSKKVALTASLMGGLPPMKGKSAVKPMKRGGSTRGR